MSRLIVFEGLDGCGKTTQAALLNEYLDKNGIRTLLSREPGGSKFSDTIRELFINNAGELSKEIEYHLMYTARMYNINHVYKPAMAKGNTVILDRYVDSTFAYQFDSEDNYVFNLLIQKTLKALSPDIVFYLERSYENTVDNLKNRKNKNKRDFISEETFKEISGRYALRKSTAGYDFHTIDTNGKTIKEINKEIIKHYELRFPKG